MRGRMAAWEEQGDRWDRPCPAVFGLAMGTFGQQACSLPFEDHCHPWRGSAGHAKAQQHSFAHFKMSSCVVCSPACVEICFSQSLAKQKGWFKFRPPLLNALCFSEHWFFTCLCVRASELDLSRHLLGSSWPSKPRRWAHALMLSLLWAFWTCLLLKKSDLKFSALSAYPLPSANLVGSVRKTVKTLRPALLARRKGDGSPARPLLCPQPWPRGRSHRPSIDRHHDFGCVAGREEES